jgi:hypothetical protein
LPEFLDSLAGELGPRCSVWNSLPTEFFDDRSDPALKIRCGILN